jgi:hypothetical protein
MPFADHAFGRNVAERKLAWYCAEVDSSPFNTLSPKSA